MPWALIIIILFLDVAAMYAVPNIITGTSATENVITTVTPWVAALVGIGLITIAIWGRRH